MAQISDVPTIGEFLPGFETGSWQGILAPAGTPRDIIVKLHNAIVSVLKSPDTQQRFDQIGFEVVGDMPEHFAATLKTEGEVIGAVIRKAGIKAD